MRIGIAGGALSLLLAGCSALLPRTTDVDSHKFRTYDQVMASYEGISQGKTRLAELPALGFDTRTTPNIEVLSYTEIVDRFVPSETLSLDHIAPAARTCIEAQFRCSAYVFHLQNSRTDRNGGVVPDLLGVEQDTIKTGWSAEIVLLLQDDLVVYKVISGQPNIEDRRDKTQPLGPFQDVGKNILGSPSSD